MNRVIHFEIQVDDLTRAKKFYAQVFDWKYEDWSFPGIEYIGIMTADKESTERGINGGMLKRPANTPPTECGTNAFVCTIEVDDFDATATKIEKAGGKVALPKAAIPGLAWQGYFLDTEGNTFGLHQLDKNAK